MRAFWSRLIVLLAVSGAVTLGAQPSPLAPVCPEGKKPILETHDVVVELAPATAFGDSTYSPAQRARILFYADAMQRHFVPPATLGTIPTLLAGSPAALGSTGETVGDVLTGRLIMIVNRNGRLRALAWEYSPISIRLANAIVLSAQAADSAGEFEGIMRPDEPGAIDTLALDVRSAAEVTSAGLPVMRARFEGYRAETLAMVSKQGKMEYPESARRVAVGTKGVVQFVIGSDATVVSQYTQVIKAGWRDFIKPMVGAISTATYIAATSGGCAVPALVRQPFTFEITKRP